MKKFKTINAKDFKNNLFKMIGTDWMLITTEAHDKVNSMTASCGGFGNIYPYEDVAFIFVKPQRYTNTLLKQSSTFSLNFFSPEYHSQLSYFGSVSGKDEDKVTKSGLTVLHTNDTPYYEEAQTIFICTKILIQPLTEKSLVDQNLSQKLYPNKDYHIMYAGKIEKVLIHSSDSY